MFKQAADSGGGLKSTFQIKATVQTHHNVMIKCRACGEVLEGRSFVNDFGTIVYKINPCGCQRDDDYSEYDNGCCYCQ